MRFGHHDEVSRDRSEVASATTVGLVNTVVVAQILLRQLVSSSYFGVACRIPSARSVRRTY
jgi:hypothetical protein